MYYSIIIINYNLSNEVDTCIDSIIESIENSKFEIILVDNYSEDESVFPIVQNLESKMGQNFKFIRTDRNIGFGNACNLAVRSAVGNVLFFLNPDTLINKDIIKLINDEVCNNSWDYNKSVLGLNVDQRKLVDFSAGFFPNFLFEILNVISIGRFIEAVYVKVLSFLSTNKFLKVNWVMGASLIIGKRLFLEINGFDPDYFLYFEEMDLCKRVIQRGYSIYYLSNINIEHIGSVGSKKNYYFFTKMFYKGKLLFLKKHLSRAAYCIYKILMRMHIINQIILWWSIRFLNSEKSNGKIKAFKELLSNLNHPEVISNSI